MRQIGPRWRWLAGAGALLVAAIGIGAAVRTAAAAEKEGAWLGVYTQDLTSGLREGLGYNGDGVLVSGVVDGSPADDAGIRKGDVLIRFNNRQIDDAGDLVNLVRAARVGQRVAILADRDGVRRTFNVTLAARSGDALAPRAERWTWRSDDDHGDDENGDDDHDDVKVFDNGRVRIEKNGDGDTRIYRFKGGDEGPHAFRFDDDGDVTIPELHELEGLKDLEGLKGLRVLGGQGRLGVQIQDLNGDLGSYFETDKGALVTRVVEGSAADKAGMKAGDVITRFDGKSIDDTDDLMAAVRAADEGDVDVTVIRKGRTQTLHPTLARAPGVHAWSWSGDRTPEQIRELADRARAHADRARVQADRMRQRSERLRNRDDEQQLRREMERLKEEMRELGRRLDRMQDEDGD